MFSSRIAFFQFQEVIFYLYIFNVVKNMITPMISRDIGSQGAEMVCTPLGVFGALWSKGLRVKTPAEAAKTLTCHKICVETDEKACRGSQAPLTIWANQKTGPV